MNAELEMSLLRAAMNRGPEADEAIFGLHAAGLSEASIAEKFGLSITKIQGAIRQARLARPAIERRENRVTYELHRALLAKLEADPEPIIKCGLQNIALMRQEHLAPYALGWVERWHALLTGDLAELKSAMLKPGHDAEDLRQMSPFAGALTQTERLIAIKKASVKGLGTGWSNS